MQEKIVDFEADITVKTIVPKIHLVKFYTKSILYILCVISLHSKNICPKINVAFVNNKNNFLLKWLRYFYSVFLS